MGGVSSIDGEWESICKMLSIDQDPEFIDLLGDISYDDQNSRLSPTWNNDLSQSSCNGSRDHMSSISPLSSSDFLVEPRVQDKVPLRKKRARVSKDIIPKGKRKTKKSRNKVVQEEEESLNGYMSDESNDEEYSKETLKSNIGKKRASRGAAIDPQSLYARKRRERINERLRILQTLVPNGTKVDISTMLEEAVHYVKFMQMQIKMLSSEDMWMYAPLAFNGFDVGLYNNLSPYPLP